MTPIIDSFALQLDEGMFLSPQRIY